MGKIVVLDPSALPRVTRRPLARRAVHLRAAEGGPRAPAGLRIGFLSNKKANADLLLDELRGILLERLGGFETVRAEKSAPLPAPKEVLEELATCDAVVTAIAD